MTGPSLDEIMSVAAGASPEMADAVTQQNTQQNKTPRAMKLLDGTVLRPEASAEQKPKSERP